MNSTANDSFIYSYLFRCFLLFIFITSYVSPTQAQGDLLIYPKRVVFDGNEKVKRLTLSNIGKDTAVYNISFLEYKMNDNGAMKIITELEEGLYFASTHVRFFPRKVTLAPNESQAVKIQVRNTQNLKEGEYRSHLYFRAEEDKGALGKTKKKQDSTISVQLKTVFGISIPCIVRKGTNTTSVSISDLQYLTSKEQDYMLQFNLNRAGNMSTYGDFTINYSTASSVVYEVAKIKGVGVYTPGNLRIMKIRLNKPENIDFEGGIFKVIFTKNESKEVLSEANLKL
jgi:hypothetical protein